jgi:glutamate formiminotransferase/glutamate formiminotransferase/formiminotetrahydrofolate cyclodeaminase
MSRLVQIMSDKPLLAVPNVSEGRRQATIDAVGRAFTAAGAARLLDVHSDVDHHRSVFTLAGVQGSLSGALLAGARVAVEHIDVGQDREAEEIGVHPHVGAIDVMPLVYLDVGQRGAACAEALVVASELGEDLGVPVFLYGELAQGRTRAELRRGGVAGLAQRLSKGELRPDFGPPSMHPTAGATLVAAREPLVAFNLELAAPTSVEDAKRIASLVREGGAEGLAGLRAIGVALSGRGTESKSSMPPARAGDMPSGDVIAQLSMNIERPLELPLRAIVEAVRRHAEIACAELVGLAPSAAFAGFPNDVALRGFDPEAHVIENALGF